ncbi:MAG: DUF1015 family protein [Planctomycetes bacterium]|nr:DUF1015 family protein [Planctomycetota bacterium]
MPKLLPIRAYRYAVPNADVSSVIAPPYDVLDEGPKQALLAKDPHNIVAVDLPVTPPKTVGPDSAYAAAGHMYRKWISEGVFTREAKPAVYAYEQAYTTGGKTYARRGLFCAVGVEEFNRPGGGIFRHEMTIQGGTDDRLKLMNATDAQLSPVFSVFDDAGERVTKLLSSAFARPADFHGRTDDDKVEHRVWIITDEPAISALAKALEKTDIFIADGHHRYTTALNYFKAHPNEPLAKGCLMVLVPEQDPGLIVLPTHRVLKGLVDFEMGKLIEVIKADGRLSIVKSDHGADGTPQMLDDLPGYGAHALGLYDPSTGRTWVVSANSADPLASDLPDKPAVWRMLDVAVFHELLVDRIIRPAFGGAGISYAYPHQLTELIRQTHDQPGRLGVVMQPTPLRSVCDVARANAVMPPKSTFFFPKLATGLIINPLN